MSDCVNSASVTLLRPFASATDPGEVSWLAAAKAASRAGCGRAIADSYSRRELKALSMKEGGDMCMCVVHQAVGIRASLRVAFALPVFDACVSLTVGLSY